MLHIHLHSVYTGGGGAIICLRLYLLSSRARIGSHLDTTPRVNPSSNPPVKAAPQPEKEEEDTKRTATSEERRTDDGPPPTPSPGWGTCGKSSACLYGYRKKVFRLCCGGLLGAFPALIKESKQFSTLCVSPQ